MEELEGRRDEVAAELAQIRSTVQVGVCLPVCMRVGLAFSGTKWELRN